MQKSFFYVLFRHFFARFVFFLRNLVKEQSKCPLLHVTEMLLIVQIYFFRHVIKMAGDRERGLPAKVGIWIHNIFFYSDPFYFCFFFRIRNADPCPECGLSLIYYCFILLPFSRRLCGARSLQEGREDGQPRTLSTSPRH